MTGKNEEELLKELAYYPGIYAGFGGMESGLSEKPGKHVGNVEDNKRQFQRNSPFIYLPHSRRGWLPGNLYEDYVNLLKKAADSRYADLIDAELFSVRKGQRSLFLY